MHARHTSCCYCRNGKVMSKFLNDPQVSRGKKSAISSTPLIDATFGGHEGIVNILLTDFRVNPNAFTDCGRTAIMWAVKCEHEAIVRILLADSRVDRNRP
ncbi:hypothetical protein K469DRAFT_796975 [Zopfia rhizophila CBS 207.26]|uniref:Uncharacterized protein n=1 Tax=Zopfia rhizophila CBS 207.26 TaxID=1314779 RepID=A0A6A6DNU7_9PEZI|nr:hypothetical protein K469DRAFT_796975 [Zopfia rhizophila CBS 207.26]